MQAHPLGELSTEGLLQEKVFPFQMGRLQFPTEVTGKLLGFFNEAGVFRIEIDQIILKQFHASSPRAFAVLQSAEMTNLERYRQK